MLFFPCLDSRHCRVNPVIPFCDMERKIRAVRIAKVQANLKTDGFRVEGFPTLNYKTKCIWFAANAFVW